jgi:prevent-host-death family protein
MSVGHGDDHTVGLRELRQNASGLVRRAEAGETLTITVSGRPAAVLGPVDRRQWRTAEEIAGLFAQDGADRGWNEVRDLVDDEVRDPWADR